ncbi:alcohol dehydrogenase [Actinoalloteichus sp. AHMU CJ021]|uniref:D-arabinose 1-dehydrogenase, Zn-dependent alcohol dehydrogenase family n=1 Tax=Actinoalloteichus caeruleus DSM 43889 TaxID=1120930 RepID=A0ABT1JCU0_ACTCY|nr:alcohol dehydrogenase catalytic domain-containing protein [Actinoalloteichus caeruleus]AUS80716.1 alcohol dehydrogenase [Actinoalloteichus sp. AHMU CJ021]MCP2330109.1 D-arabinose 1-dehydrogenase, Zn-dependent alcohol dehydrogenase family [Actinoalloteichus caeruleus DSM 43889]
MRAFVVVRPGAAVVREVDPPVAVPGEVLVDVSRVGVCGTDVEFFTGEMQYLRDGHAHYPLRLGHEWTGTVAAVGTGVDEAWVGRRVVGDTMLGCRACDRCRRGRRHVCDRRVEVGIRGGRDGALAERLAVPADSLHAVPDAVDDTAAALVEPGGNALRAVLAARLAPGDRLLVLGPGTIGLLVAMFARAEGAEVHVLGLPGAALDFAAELGVAEPHTRDALPPLTFHAVVDASNDPALPALAVDLVEPGGRVVYVGLAGAPSLVDTRALTLRDVTAVGVLSASPALAATIDRYASGSVDPRPLVAATVPLGGVAGVLGGRRPPGALGGPKIQVDPRLPG